MINDIRRSRKLLRPHSLGEMKVLDRLAVVARRRHLSPATIACYRSWVRQFLVFCRIEGRWRHPRELGAADVEAFLNHLAGSRRLSASSQNQEVCAIVF